MGKAAASKHVRVLIQDPEISLADGAACLRDAVNYLKMGISVLPLCHPDHVGFGKGHHSTCKNPGKVPLVSWEEFERRLPTENDVYSWWRTWPTANLGAAMGTVSGLVRIDVEGAGVEILKRLSDGDLPRTWEFSSGRCDGTGRGMLYRVPTGDFRTKEKIEYGKPGELRLQGTGAQTVLPPSRHVDGALYTWVAGQSPDAIYAAVAPKWVLAAMESTPTKLNGIGGSHRTDEEWEGIFGGVQEGSRNESAVAMIGKLLSCIGDIGNSNQLNTIWLSAAAVNQLNCPPLPEDELRSIFTRLTVKEAKQREKCKQERLNQFVAQQINDAEPAPGSPEKANGKISPPAWHLIIIASNPPTFRLRSPFWSDSTMVENGYILLDTKQILNWSPKGNGIRSAVFEQAGKIIPASLKDWANPGGFLENLMARAGREEAIVDMKRDLVVAGWFYRYLQFPATLKEKKDDPDRLAWPHKQGTLTRHPSGDLYFKRDHVEQKIHFEHKDFTRPEITQTLKRFAEPLKIENNRWWMVKADQVAVIGRLSGEME